MWNFVSLYNLMTAGSQIMTILIWEGTLSMTSDRSECKRLLKYIYILLPPGTGSHCWGQGWEKRDSFQPPCPPRGLFIPFASAEGAEAWPEVWGASSVLQYWTPSHPGWQRVGGWPLVAPPLCHILSNPQDLLNISSFLVSTKSFAQPPRSAGPFLQEAPLAWRCTRRTWSQLWLSEWHRFHRHWSGLGAVGWGHRESVWGHERSLSFLKLSKKIPS